MGRQAKKHRGVYEHPAGSEVWWIVYFVNGRRRREKVGGRQAAIDRYQQRKVEAREGRLPVREKPILFADFAKDFIEANRRKLADIESYERFASRWTERFKGRTLTSILPIEVEKWAARRAAEDVSPYTVNRELSFLRRVFNVARRNHLVAENPVSPDHFYEQPDGRVRFLQDEEETQLRAELTSDQWKVVEFAMHTGMRAGQQFRLRWEKVDLANAIARVRRKRRGGVQEQKVYLDDTAVAILRSLRSRFRGAWVFLSATGATPVHPDNFVRRVFRPALERAGIKDFRWHDLRHYPDRRIIPTRRACARRLRARPLADAA